MTRKCNKRHCGHKEYRDGHCGEMLCSNYVNKCPAHSITDRSVEQLLRDIFGATEVTEGE